MPEAPNLSLQRPSRKTPPLWPSSIPHNGFLPSRLTTTELRIWLYFNHATASFKAFCCAIKKYKNQDLSSFYRGEKAAVLTLGVCVGGKLSMFGRRNHAGYGSVNVHVLLHLQRLFDYGEKKGLCYISLDGERFCFRSLVRGRHSTSCWMAVLKIADKLCQQTAWPCLMDIVLVFDYVWCQYITITRSCAVVKDSSIAGWIVPMVSKKHLTEIQM